MENNGRVYTEATPRLKALHKAYGGSKSGGGAIDFATYFDNTDTDDNSGNFYAATARTNSYWKNRGYKHLTEQEFIQHLDLVELDDQVNGTTFNPQPHYDNSNGSLYKVATDRNWNAYIFDVVKRLERGGKKDPLKQEIEKSIDVLKIWLTEL